MSTDTRLLGVGLYTPAEAQRLIGVRAGTLVRWLRGHSVSGRPYEPLWTPQVRLDGGDAVLGFRDLIQARVAAALIGEGLSARKLRLAITLARDIVGDDHPLANAGFRSDGKTLLLQILTPGEDDRLIDLFSGGQYVMRTIIEPSLSGIEFVEDLASRWWPAGKRAGICLDPNRQFGQPIDARSGVPTRVLSRAVTAEGSVDAVSRAYEVPTAAVRQAIAFEHRLAA